MKLIRCPDTHAMLVCGFHGATLPPPRKTPPYLATAKSCRIFYGVPCENNLYPMSTLIVYMNLPLSEEQNECSNHVASMHYQPPHGMYRT